MEFTVLGSSHHETMSWPCLLIALILYLVKLNYTKLPWKHWKFCLEKRLEKRLGRHKAV